MDAKRTEGPPEPPAFCCYFANFGAETSFPAKALGPGLDREKSIFAAQLLLQQRRVLRIGALHAHRME